MQCGLPFATITTPRLHYLLRKLLTLIRKDKDIEDIHNWRPITLETTIYKIYSKTLMLRVQPLLIKQVVMTTTTFSPS